MIRATPANNVQRGRQRFVEEHLELLLLSFAMLACQRSAPAARSEQEPANKESAVSVVSTPRPMRPAASSGISSPDALALVREYLKRDGEGTRLRHNAWFDSAVVQPNYEPGYDEFTAISAYHSSLGPPMADTFVVNVKYDVLGPIRQVIVDNAVVGWQFVVQNTVETVRFPVVNDNGRLKIISPQVNQHVLPATLLDPTRIKFPNPGDTTKLRAATQRKPK